MVSPDARVRSIAGCVEDRNTYRASLSGDFFFSADFILFCQCAICCVERIARSLELFLDARDFGRPFGWRDLPAVGV